MLPSSHEVHIEANDALGILPGTALLPDSRMTLMPATDRSPAMLAEAFGDFIAASARLEMSYRELQAEVQLLGSELKERNLALHASLAENQAMRQSLEQILDSMPCGVLVVDGAGQIAMANPEAARLLRLPPESLESLARVRRERGIDLGPGLGAGTATADDTAEQELRLSAADGREWWLAVRRRALDQPWDNATAERSVVILRDVSARRRMEAERDRARSAVALAEVSAVLAHEIRNPLASLELFAELVADCPERAGDWVGPMRAGIRGLSGTVNNVLTLYGGGAPALERVELGRELALAVEFLGPQAAQADVQVRLDVAPEAELAPVRANRGALQQIVLNLCTNALRHTAAGGTLVVSARRTESAMLVAVRDTGVGMPAEVLAQLFGERFSGSGTTPGLGLAVCARLMRQMGGAIRVTSQVGVGSEFTLEFQTGNEAARR